MIQMPVLWMRRVRRRGILRPGERRSATSDLLSSETRERRRRMLRTAMGPSIAFALDEPDVVEVMAHRAWLSDLLLRALWRSGVRKSEWRHSATPGELARRTT
jgi:hypothetical protein